MSDEITPLNAEALDVEELERRVELAGLLPNADCWSFTCGTNSCTGNCADFAIVP